MGIGLPAETRLAAMRQVRVNERRADGRRKMTCDQPAARVVDGSERAAAVATVSMRLIEGGFCRYWRAVLLDTSGARMKRFLARQLQANARRREIRLVHFCDALR